MRFFLLIAAALILPACSLFDPGEVVVSGRAVDVYTGEPVAVEARLTFAHVLDFGELSHTTSGDDGRFELAGEPPAFTSGVGVTLQSVSRTLFPLYSDTAQPSYFATYRRLEGGRQRLGDIPLVPMALLVARFGRPLSPDDSLSIAFRAQRDVLGEQTAERRSFRVREGEAYPHASDFVAGNTEATVRWEYFPVTGPPQSGELVVYCPRDETTEVTILG
jgi:hypothetical protein